MANGNGLRRSHRRPGKSHRIRVCWTGRRPASVCAACVFCLRSTHTIRSKFSKWRQIDIAALHIYSAHRKKSDAKGRQKTRRKLVIENKHPAGTAFMDRRTGQLVDEHQLAAIDCLGGRVTESVCVCVWAAAARKVNETSESHTV